MVTWPNFASSKYLIKPFFWYALAGYQAHLVLPWLFWYFGIKSATAEGTLFSLFSVTVANLDLQYNAR